MKMNNFYKNLINKKWEKMERGISKLYRHEAVEVSRLDHLAQPECFLFNGAFAGLARRSSRLGVLRFPGLLRVRHSSYSLSLTRESHFWFWVFKLISSVVPYLSYLKLKSNLYPFATVIFFFFFFRRAVHN